MFATSGCIGGADELELEAAVQGGSVGLATDPVLAEGEGDLQELEPPEIVQVNVKWQGKIGTSACAAVTIGFAACPEATPMNNRFAVDYKGDLSRVRVELTWTPSTPLTQELTFSVGGYTVDKKPQAMAYLKGASPLAVDLDASAFDIADKVHFSIGVPAQLAPVPGTLVSPSIGAAVEQPIAVNGMLLSLVPEA